MGAQQLRRGPGEQDEQGRGDEQSERGRAGRPGLKRRPPHTVALYRQGVCGDAESDANRTRMARGGVSRV
ncbi:hypothetical protein GCM10010272_50550 [Streptomyces lateritius]|nr:hypothetical protein GCM10010272_50550 [Streptomyces lateritius]